MVVLLSDIKLRIKSYSHLYNLDPSIVYGVCKTESNLNSFAMRYETGYKYLVDPKKVRPSTCSINTESILQKCSFGLMQVMGSVFREYGYARWLSEIITDIDLQISYGCRHLSNKIKKYGLQKGIASYNSGSPRYDKNGKLANQEYVDLVMGYTKEWKDE